MDEERITKMKKHPFFQPRDLLLYGIVAVFISLLFLSVFLSTDKSEITGLDFSYGGKRAATFDFSSCQLKEYGVENVSFDCDFSDDGQTITVTVHTGQDGINIVRIDRSSHTAVMQDADCSASKDCTYIKISSAADSIVCLPHKLVVSPVTEFILPEGVTV